MGLPHSGFLKDSEVLLRIETDQFDLFIQGKPYHPTVEALSLHRQDGEWVEATLDIVTGDIPITVQRVLLFSPNQGRLIEFGQEPVYPLFYETQEYQLFIRLKTEKKVEFFHENIHLRKAVKSVDRDLLSGRLNFQNEVGYTDLVIRVEGQDALVIRLEIFPVKLDYKRDYQALLEDVNREMYNLAFDFLRKTYQWTGFKESRNQSFTEFFAILRQIFMQLIQAMMRIQSAPHHQLRKSCHVKSADRVVRAGKENLAFLSRRPHVLIPDEKGFLQVGTTRYRPTKLMETKKRIDYDTPENRFLRWLLQRISGKLKEMKRYLQEKQSLSDPWLMHGLEQMEAQLEQLLRADFLQSVGEMRHMSVTLVLQMAPGYREVFRYYLMLMKGLAIQGDLFRLSMKDLAQLYEYWCFLKLHSLLKEKYELVNQDVIQVNRIGLFFTLRKSQSASVTYRNPKNGEVFVLYYHSLPKEESGHWPTLPQLPDTVLTLKKKEASAEYKYVFDAKYRLNPAYRGTDYQRKYGSPGPEEGDINTMHRYRDAIVYQNDQTGEYERSMFGAYVLFPYADEEKYREHHFYKSIKKVNVGALPFLPNATKLVEEFLDELILDSPEKAYERSTRPRGTDEYYRDKLSGKNVLVGSLGSKDQLRVCLQGRFYYMPLKLLIREQHLLTNISYIALYQSRRFFGEEAGIHWIGKVNRWDVVKRKEIAEIPVRRGNDDELYVRFTIDRWEKRIPPIYPGGHGVYSHLLTTKYILDRAVEIAELRIETEEVLKEWREKRRLGKVKVGLNHEQVDMANKVLNMEIVD